MKKEWKADARGHLNKNCHPERSFGIHNVNSKTQSKDPASG
jgi:hypothetical protein